LWVFFHMLMTNSVGVGSTLQQVAAS